MDRDPFPRRPGSNWKMADTQPTSTTIITQHLITRVCPKHYKILPQYMLYTIDFIGQMCRWLVQVWESEWPKIFLITQMVSQMERSLRGKRDGNRKTWRISTETQITARRLPNEKVEKVCIHFISYSKKKKKIKKSI